MVEDRVHDHMNESLNSVHIQLLANMSFINTLVMYWEVLVLSAGFTGDIVIGVASDQAIQKS